MQAGRGLSHSTVTYSQSPMQGTTVSHSPDVPGRGYGFNPGSSELPPPAHTSPHHASAPAQADETPNRPQFLTDRGYFYDDDDVTCQYIKVSDEMFHDERAMFRHMMEEGRNLQAARNHHMFHSTQSSSPMQQQQPKQQQQDLPSPQQQQTQQQHTNTNLASPPSSVSGALSNGATTPVFTDHGGEPGGEQDGEGEGEEEEEYYEEYEEEEFEETDGSDLDWIEEQLELHRKQHLDDPTLFWG
jgi:hypothetical protein